MASFEGITVGDEVVVRPPSTWRPRTVARVEAVTRTQFVAGGYRFRKKDGGHVGSDGWHSAHAYQVTPELLAEVETEHRYLSARENLIKLRNQLETFTREIDRTHNKYLLADAMEAAAADMAAAVTKLREAFP